MFRELNSRPTKRRSPVWLGLLGLLLCLSGPAGCRPLSESSPAPTPTPDPAPLSAPPEVRVVYPNVPGSFVATVKTLKPSVVSIFAKQLVGEGPRGLNIFGELFGLPNQDRVRRSLGTGFVIDAQGYVFTNFHVVQGAYEIMIQLEDGREVPATPVGADAALDVALLHIDAPQLTPVTLGDSDALEVGEWVLAIGNPFGLSHTVTAGIVSAKGRGGRDVGMRTQGYQNFIQTDASINPGNSGGPLSNTAGEVIGMNTAISAEGQGIGFAVPINMLRTILPQLKNAGRIVPAWIGVGIRELNDELRRMTGATEGIMVTELYENSPAHRAGIQPGDIIVSFNQQPVKGVEALAWMTNTAGVGNVVAIEVLRDGKRAVHQVRVEARPAIR